MRETDRLHPRSLEVTNEWSCTYTPPICLHSVYRKQLHLLRETVTTNRESDLLYYHHHHHHQGVPVDLL